MSLLLWCLIATAPKCGIATVMFRGKELTRDEAAQELKDTDKVLRGAQRAERQHFREVTVPKMARQDARDARAQAEVDKVQGRINGREEAAAKVAADSKAFADRKAASHAAESMVNPFAGARDSFKSRRGPDGHRFQIRSEAGDPKAYRFGVGTPAFSPGKHGFCMAVPDAKDGWRNGLTVTMAPCDESDELQYFIYDPLSTYIHPDPSRTWCLDYAGATGLDKELRVQYCDKKWSPNHGDGHQKWSFANNSYVKNADTSLCLTTQAENGDDKAGKRVFTGKGVRQHSCDGKALEQLWTWLPRGGAFKAMEIGRLWQN